MRLLLGGGRVQYIEHIVALKPGTEHKLTRSGKVKTAGTAKGLGAAAYVRRKV